MTDSLFTLLGGVGLFLLGMTLLTDGLKAFAGDTLRRALVRFTGKPLTALVSGVLATALVQSSTATTMTMIGFVSAGLLTFPQALGVVLGSSLGNTSTGWLVSAVGFKISIGHYALPLVGLGAFVRLLAPARWRSLGIAVAGFGLIFVGIATLQQAMSNVPPWLDLNRLSDDFWGRVLGVGVGIGIPVVLQSSSAAIAAVLTAMHTGTLGFEQAAVFVIGASIGTAVASSVAAVGGSVPAKRTALAMVLFNIASGALAFVTLPVYIHLLEWANEQFGMNDPAIGLAAFHTAFMAAGVVLLFPLIPLFSRWVEKLLPDDQSQLTANLDRSLHTLPGIALETLRRTLMSIAAHQFRLTVEALTEEGAEDAEERREQAKQALDESRAFFAKIPPVSDDLGVSTMRLHLLHATDHLVRLLRYSTPTEEVRRLATHPWLVPAVAKTREMLECATREMENPHPRANWTHELEDIAAKLAELSQEERPELLRQTASGEWSPADAMDALDTLRWLSKVTNHVWRVAHYLTIQPGKAEVALPAAWEEHDEA